MFRKIIFVCLYLAAMTACSSSNDTGGSMDYDTRIGIDTQTNAAVSRLTSEIDRYCRDSTEELRQHLIDSLLVARRAEMTRTIQGVKPDSM